MTMFKLVKGPAVLGIVLAACVGTAQAASAPSVALAKKCRAMMVQAYPPKPAGSLEGNAPEQRKYFRTCLARAGNMNSTDSTVGSGKQSR
jgi:hypothetical protein